jgi:hypothetical protein
MDWVCSWDGYYKIWILQNEELCDLYRSAVVVRVVKCGRLRWTGYVAGVDVT